MSGYARYQLSQDARGFVPDDEPPARGPRWKPAWLIQAERAQEPREFVTCCGIRFGACTVFDLNLLLAAHEKALHS